MERCVWWVFIYPVAMHGPCGHVCARVAPFTWLLPTTTLTSTRLLPSTAPNHHPNNNDNTATLPAQRTASHLTSPTDERLQQAVSHLTSPMDKQRWWPASHLKAHQTQRPQTASHLASPTDEQQRWTASHPTSPTDEQQWWMVTKLGNGCATMSRRWRCMSSSLSVSLSEHHESPPCLLYSHENQGATLPSATWQVSFC